jgi:hypothetical protein
MQALIAYNKNVLKRGQTDVGRFSDKTKEDGSMIGAFNYIGNMLVPFWLELVKGSVFSITLDGNEYKWKCAGIATTGDDDWNGDIWGIGSREFCCHICKQPKSSFMDFTLSCECARTLGDYKLN